MEHVTSFVLRFGVPIAMTGVYGVLAWSAETSTTGKAWMAIGLGFVYVIWWVFRVLTTDAALSRAVSHGDAPRLLALTERALARTKPAAVRVPHLIHRALAQAIQEAWPAALVTLAEVDLAVLPRPARPRWQLRAAAIRVAALAETGEVAEARRVLEAELLPAASQLDPRREPEARVLSELTRGRVLLAEGQGAAAHAALTSVVTDIRAGEHQRATAQRLLARI